MSEMGASQAGCGWRQGGGRAHSAGPCILCQVFYVRCCGKLLKVLNRGITFYILFWLSGRELNDVKLRVKKIG